MSSQLNCRFLRLDLYFQCQSKLSQTVFQFEPFSRSLNLPSSWTCTTIDIRPTIPNNLFQSKVHGRLQIWLMKITLCTFRAFHTFFRICLHQERLNQTFERQEWMKRSQHKGYITKSYTNKRSNLPEGVGIRVSYSYKRSNLPEGVGIRVS